MRRLPANTRQKLGTPQAALAGEENVEEPRILRGLKGRALKDPCTLGVKQVTDAFFRADEQEMPKRPRKRFKRR